MRFIIGTFETKEILLNLLANQLILTYEARRALFPSFTPK